jgi:DNA-nicking Smr family endonuclease
VDLHGVTIHEAWGVVNDHIYHGVQNGYKKLLIITGRSGQINQELPRWLERNPHVRSVTQMPNGGSWEIAIKPVT